MKKLFIFSLSLLASVLATASTVSSDNTFGILKITATSPETIIGVPWVGVGSGYVNVSNIVLTSNLTVGDLIYYYDTTSTKYKIWELGTNAGGDKIWKPCTTVTINANNNPGEADQQSLPRGNALILKMTKTDPAGEQTESAFWTARDKDIYIYGQYAALGDGDKTTLSLTTSANSNSIVWNLIAPPSVSSYDINSATLGFDPTVGDAIVTNALPSSWIRYKEGNWGRVIDVKNQHNIITGKVFQVGAEVAPGVGAWYRATGEHTTGSSTITW